LVKKLFCLILILFCQHIFAEENTIIAVVDEKTISSNMIEFIPSKTYSLKDKVKLINEKIDIILQLEKAKELNISASESQLETAIFNISSNKNTSIEKLKKIPGFSILEKELLDRITIMNLKGFVIKKNLVDKTILFDICSKENPEKDLKQIKIAQIIISETEDHLFDSNKDNSKIEALLTKIRNHINNGATFETFAKLYSQHPSYYNGGLTDWLNVKGEILMMIDSLKKNKVSNIYLNDFGLAIAIKTDERFISSKLDDCIDKKANLKFNQLYSEWVDEIRKKAYIKIYYDKLY